MSSILRTGQGDPAISHVTPNGPNDNPVLVCIGIPTFAFWYALYGTIRLHSSLINRRHSDSKHTK